MDMRAAVFRHFNAAVCLVRSLPFQCVEMLPPLKSVDSDRLLLQRDRYSLCALQTESPKGLDC